MSERLSVYEHPLTERIRSALRMEHLFHQLELLHGYRDEAGQRAFIFNLCDLLALISRAETWAELAKALKFEHARIAQLKEDPRVRADVLAETLSALEEQQHAIAQVSANGIHIPKMLMAVMQRQTVPGGTAPHDLPVFSHWLSQSRAQQNEDIAQWTTHFDVYRRALNHQLELVRARGEWRLCALESGSCTLSLNQPRSLLRVAAIQQAPWYPEVSAGRQRATITLRSPDPSLSAEGVSEIQIALC